MSKQTSSFLPRALIPYNSWLFCIVIVLAFFIPYVIVNHLPLHRKIAPFILNEEMIPFLPWTFIVYISAYIQAPMVLRYMPKTVLFKLLKLLGICVTISMLTYIVLPLRFPRELIPVSNQFVKNFHSTDPEGNCFPSLHVVMTTVFAYCYGLVQPSKFKRILMWIWAIAMVLSVLTTKQHYVIDIFGGLALALPTIFILGKYHRNVQHTIP